MLSNKPQQLSQIRSHTLSISNYLVQFSYRNRSKPKHKSMLSHSLEGQLSTRKKFSTQKTGLHTASPTNSQNRESRPRKRQKLGLFLTEGNEPAITQAFPSRKVKTNEHQLFKILAKLEYHHGKRKRNEDMYHRKPLPMQGSARKSNKSQHKPPPHLCNWVKERYCVNRDKDNGNFPASFFRSESSPIQVSLMVKNPIRR